MSASTIESGTKVLILGLGQYPQGSGVSAALYALEQGAIVRVTDLKTEKELEQNVKRLRRFTTVRFILGKHRLQDIRWADVIIRNPRVRPTAPEMQEAIRLGKRIESDVSLFMARCPCPVIGITGTRGKSTTTTLIAEMLRRSKKRVWVGGNILISPLTFLSKIKKDDLVVLELSSWLLETTGVLGFSPAYAVVTNLMRDHLNTYSGMDEYAEAKAQIFRHQRPDGVVVLPADDFYGRQWKSQAPGRVLTFGKTRVNDAWMTKTDLVWKDPVTGKRQMLLLRKKIKILGEHNLGNILAAALTARSAGASVPAIRSAISFFKGLENRLEIVAVKKGIRFINDTTASTPDAVIAALRALRSTSRHIFLIAGGADKDLEFQQLSQEMKKYSLTVFLLPGTAHHSFRAALTSSKIAFYDTPVLSEAFRNALAAAKRGDTILLSPGCASFGLFNNEFERGEAFKQLVKNVR